METVFALLGLAIVGLPFCYYVGKTKGDAEGRAAVRKAWREWIAENHPAASEADCKVDKSLQKSLARRERKLKRNFDVAMKALDKVVESEHRP